MNATTIMISLACLGIGVLVGSLASHAYFRHLEIEVEKLVHRDMRYGGLLLGAALRIVVLLALAWLVLWAAGPWSAAGYAAAFLLIRSITVRRALRREVRVKTEEVQSCN